MNYFKSKQEKLSQKIKFYSFLTFYISKFTGMNNLLYLLNYIIRIKRKRY